ncbi:MAG TPA: SDR family NAD(P)-dependent oxidoreductase [Steroidobacteraceae bacterium]|nr:SDR family NAD(P)-dependent oxidoreductase [Steroidobacteraceae bacterium]
MLIRDSVCLVTGAASGLGRATVTELLRRGARVAALDLSAPANAVGHEKSFLGLSADVTDEVSVSEALAQVIEHFGALHACVNCAGIIIPSPLLSGSGPSGAAPFRRVIDVNLTGTYIVSCHATALIARGKPRDGSGERGVIVNTASIRAFEGGASGAAYAASKAGVVGMTLALARELAPLGIRVNCIAPGLMETPMFQGLAPAATAAFLESVPFPKRAGEPGEFAGLACYLLENEYLNAATIRIDAALRV